MNNFIIDLSLTETLVLELLLEDIEEVQGGYSHYDELYHLDKLYNHIRQELKSRNG